ERTLRAGGAVEPPGDVYPAMRLAYPAAFAAMIAEAWIRGRALTPLAASGLVLFGAAKALKYWAVATLGDRWTFRVLVPPGSGRIRRGPYRVMRHPNYLAVLAELSGMALAAQAPLSGIASVVVFGALIRARIRVEERALGLLGPANTPPGDGTSRRWGR
ncbi:MAG TPA: isoprenylcysteine carboxylmethyltransferase family protein, partial [Vicinamibacterales bacterium]|nr:isoprenylcysteine carboxylmethyltransferase family protein [Vicinamibacterales bacterium]